MSGSQRRHFLENFLEENPSVDKLILNSMDPKIVCVALVIIILGQADARPIPAP